MERRLSSRLPCAADRRDRGLLRRLSRRGAACRAHAGRRLCLSGRAVAASQGRAARRADVGAARHRLRQFPAEPRPDRQPRAGRAAVRAGASRRRSKPRSPSRCSRRRRRCCSWATNGARASRFRSSATSRASLPRRCANGRRKEFAEAYAQHGDDVPDPLAEQTVRLATLDWAALDKPRAPRRGSIWCGGCSRRAKHSSCRACRSCEPGHGRVEFDDGVLTARWCFRTGETLSILANLSDRPQPRPDAFRPRRAGLGRRAAAQLPPWSVYAAIGGAVVPPDIPLATYRLQLTQGLRLRRRRAHRALSQVARHHASLRLAVPQGAARQHARLRRRRSPRAQSGVRRRGGLRAAERRAEGRRPRPDPRFRAEPHGGRLRQRLVAGRAGVGPEIAARGVVRHQLGAAALPARRRRAAAGAGQALWRGADRAARSR